MSLDQETVAPRLSVALAAFNAEPFLADAVESILAQDFADFELLLLDDGSSDRTLEIAGGYKSRDRRVRIISRENRGIAASLNELLAVARAPLVARADADDICEPGRFSAQVAFLEGHPDYGIVGAQAKWIDEEGRGLDQIQARVPCSHEDIIAALEHSSPFFHPAVMMRRELVLTVGGYREAYCDAEDYDLWLRLSEVTRMANLPEAWIRYRTHEGQVSGRRIASQARKAAIAWLAHAERQAARPDPTAGMTKLPGDDAIDRLFGDGSLGYVRRRVFNEIASSPAVYAGDRWPVAVKHATTRADRGFLVRVAWRQLRAKRPLSAIRLLLAAADPT